ncbi:ABC transporter ATP-binding protein, partial [Candidatus Bipolaricaulota bacterium]|nr:ABC transporter ATP-binding protein [Candidatus Bipolaricaulota bacterium]
MSQNAIEMRDITKIFGDTVANDAVDLTVETGEIHCLLGENGAGKTTLMNVLFGLYERDQGKIFIDGNQVNITEPSQAIGLGVGMIHQNFMLTDRLTVTENIVAGAEPARGPFVDLEKARDEVENLSRKYGLTVDPEAKVEDISVGDQQRVEILKALYREAEILILDEPTAVLTPQEVEELFGIMGELRKNGKTLVFITHKLEETMAISDRVTVLRDGKDIGTMETEETNPAQLAQMMVGRDVILSVEKSDREEKPVGFRAENLFLQNPENNMELQNINFEIEEGEILGVAGVEGNGQLELEEALAGLRQIDSGSIYLGEREISELSTRKRRELGISHIPSDRLKRGMIPEFPLDWNLILGSEWKQPFASKGLLNKTEIEENRESVIP